MLQACMVRRRQSSMRGSCLDVKLHLEVIWIPASCSSSATGTPPCFQALQPLPILTSTTPQAGWGVSRARTRRHQVDGLGLVGEQAGYACLLQGVQHLAGQRIPGALKFGRPGWHPLKVLGLHRHCACAAWACAYGAAGDRAQVAMHWERTEVGVADAWKRWLAGELNNAIYCCWISGSVLL